jgi:hypothetical protein
LHPLCGACVIRHARCPTLLKISVAKRRAVFSQQLLIHTSVGMATGLAKARVGGSNAKSARCSLDRSRAGLRCSVTSPKLGERQYSFSGSHFGAPVLRCGLPFRPAPCQNYGTPRGLSSYIARSFRTPEYGRRATPRAQTPVLRVDRIARVPKIRGVPPCLKYV